MLRCPLIVLPEESLLWQKQASETSLSFIYTNYIKLLSARYIQIYIGIITNIFFYKKSRFKQPGFHRK